LLLAFAALSAYFEGQRRAARKAPEQRSQGWHTMPNHVSNNRARQRFECALEAGTAFASYRLGAGSIAIYHAEVPAAVRGSGIGSAFVRQVLTAVRRLGLKLPECSNVANGAGEKSRVRRPLAVGGGEVQPFRDAGATPCECAAAQPPGVPAIAPGLWRGLAQLSGALRRTENCGTLSAMPGRDGKDQRR